MDIQILSAVSFSRNLFILRLLFYRPTTNNTFLSCLGRFLPNHFPIIIHQSRHHSMTYSLFLENESVVK